jgi:hypothetical protein
MRKLLFVLTAFAVIAIVAPANAGADLTGCPAGKQVCTGFPAGSGPVQEH